MIWIRATNFRGGIYAGDDVRDVNAIDLDGDGKLDLVSGSYTKAG